MKNLDKHIWEGWTVQDFINELEPTLDRIQKNMSHISSFSTKKELRDFCKDNQPHYKKSIPEVVDYFSKKYNIK